MCRLPALCLCFASAVFANHSDNTLPIFFVATHGPAPADVQYFTKTQGVTASFRKKSVMFSTGSARVKMRFEGASASARIEGSKPLGGHLNLLIGSPDRWDRDEAMLGTVAYRQLYPGIDLVYGSTGSRLKSEFVVAPGADPECIRMRYSGGALPRVEADGSLSVRAGAQHLTEDRPSIYQVRHGVRFPVEGRYRLDGRTVGFEIDAYDVSLPLIIDPLLSFSSLVGGTGFNGATAIAVDSAGASYIAGYTDTNNLPTLNAVQSYNAGGNEAFVAKLNSLGEIEYCTYFGGSGDDRAYGVAVDGTGAAYIAGTTTSANFPTRNPIQSSLTGGRSAFVFKLNPSGNNLIFSTYLGGNGSDTAYGIAIDTTGNSYLVGDTTSMDLPASGFQTSYRGSQDAFVAKISADGGHLVYSTYIGGSGTEHGAAIAVDSTGAASITGYTWSLDFPTANAYQRSIGGGCDAFIARLSSDGNRLLFSTYLGGTGGSVAYAEAGQAIAVDSAGNLYVAGVTSSSDFPISRALQPILLGYTDAFITKFSPAGSLLFSTFIGGMGVEVANAIAVDASGAAYVAGYTYSDDFPVSLGSQASRGGDCDGFLVKLTPAGDALLFATYLGGSASDTISGLAVDTAGNLLLSGWTFSPDFPVILGGS